MTRRQKYGLTIFICVVFVVVIVLLGISIDTSIPESGVLIDFLGNSNSVQGPVAILQIRNNGKTPVRINAYCTIYWTNRFGVATNEFFQHNQGYAILRRGESNLVAVPHPSDAKVWETSFTYELRPGWLRRVYERITFFLPGAWAPDNSFRGRFGPLITNSMSTVESVVPSGEVGQSTPH